MVNGVPVVAAPEEIDASTADWLGELLLQAHCCGHGTFVVDMTRTRFCDSSGWYHTGRRQRSWAVARPV
jgi:anti-anti-sigma regulatory factor